MDLQIDPESFNFDIPPFSIQILAENAACHDTSIRIDMDQELPPRWQPYAERSR